MEALIDADGVPVHHFVLGDAQALQHGAGPAGVAGLELDALAALFQQLLPGELLEQGPVVEDAVVGGNLASSSKIWLARMRVMFRSRFRW